MRRHLAGLGFLVAVALVTNAKAADGPIDMRARVNELGFLPLMRIDLSDDLDEKFFTNEDMRLRKICHDDASCYVSHLRADPMVVSRVYAAPDEGSPELGVIIARRVVPHRADMGGFGVALVCQLHGEPERPRWMTIGSAMDWPETLASDFSGGEWRWRPPTRGARNYFPQWAQLPPAACGTPVWWPTASSKVEGTRVDGEGDIYRVETRVRGAFVRTGKPTMLEPSVNYRLLRIHDGVVELRREYGLDIARFGLGWLPSQDGRDPVVLEFWRRQPIPPTIRINLADIVDADGRVHLYIVYPEGC